MLKISNAYDAFRRHRTGLRLAALGALAGLAYGVAAPAPASAAPSDWRAACRFAAAPQGNGDMMRYANCTRQAECQNLANAAGTVIFMTDGCFGVSPETSPAAAQRRPTH